MERRAEPMVDPHPYSPEWWRAWRAWSDTLRNPPKRKAKKA